jgi:hypothetical protein
LQAAVSPRDLLTMLPIIPSPKSWRHDGSHGVGSSEFTLLPRRKAAI